MPITRSAIKKLRQDKKREKQNKLVKNTVKEALRDFRKKPSLNLLSKVFKLLDTASKKNIYHKTKAARLKSRLSKLLSVKKTPATPLKTTAKKKIASKTTSPKKA